MANKISLGGGRSYSEFSIHPKNWKTAAASVKEKWYVKSRYYEEGQRPFQIYRSANEFPTAAARRDHVRFIIERLRCDLEEYGWCPRTLTYPHGPGPEEDRPDPDPEPVKAPPGVGPHSSLKRALGFAILQKRAAAMDRIRQLRKSGGDAPVGVPNTIMDMRSYCRRIIPHLPVKRIEDYKRKDFLAAINALSEKSDWGASAWNNCVTYLHSLFAVLVDWEAIEHNIITGIAKKEKTDEKQTFVDAAMRSKIADHLTATGQLDYLRALRIFFESGCREAELCEVKVSYVDLEAATFKTWLRKRKALPKLVTKAITAGALPLWRELVAMAGSTDDFVFSKNFLPGPVYCLPPRWNRWWKDLVKIPLGLDFGPYKLKHAHTTEVARVSKEMAKDFNSHTSTAMNEKHYDLLSEEEKMEARKRLNLPF